MRAGGKQHSVAACRMGHLGGTIGGVVCSQTRGAHSARSQTPGEKPLSALAEGSPPGHACGGPLPPALPGPWETFQVTIQVASCVRQHTPAPGPRGWWAGKGTKFRAPSKALLLHEQNKFSCLLTACQTLLVYVPSVIHICPHPWGDCP